MSTQHTHNDSTREREVIVTDTGNGGGNGLGSALVAIVAVVVLVVLGWFAVQAISDSGADGGGIEMPSQVDVNIDGGQGGGGEG